MLSSECVKTGNLRCRSDEAASSSRLAVCGGTHREPQSQFCRSPLDDRQVRIARTRRQDTRVRPGARHSPATEPPLVGSRLTESRRVVKLCSPPPVVSLPTGQRAHWPTVGCGRARRPTETLKESRDTACSRVPIRGTCEPAPVEAARGVDLQGEPHEKSATMGQATLCCLCFSAQPL